MMKKLSFCKLSNIAKKFEHIDVRILLWKESSTTKELESALTDLNDQVNELKAANQWSK